MLVRSCAFAALLAGVSWFVACSSEGAAPLGGGGTGGTIGGGTTGGTSGGAGDAGDASTEGLAILGLVTFTDNALAVDAGTASLPNDAVTASFLEGGYADAGTLPATCTQTTGTQNDATCVRTDCPDAVTSPVVGTPRSAGVLDLGVVGQLSPAADGTYAALNIVGALAWSPGDTLTVTAAGDAVPAFTTTVVAVVPLTLATPSINADNTYPLSRSTGFAFATTQTVATLRLTLDFAVTLDAGARHVRYECSAPGTTGQLSVPAELVADLPENATPTAGSMFGENASSVDLGESAAPVGRVFVTARRAVVTLAEQTQLDWTRFVVIP